MHLVTRVLAASLFLSVPARAFDSALLEQQGRLVEAVQKYQDGLVAIPVTWPDLERTLGRMGFVMNYASSPCTMTKDDTSGPVTLIWCATRDGGDKVSISLRAESRNPYDPLIKTNIAGPKPSEESWIGITAAYKRLLEGGEPFVPSRWLAANPAFQAWAAEVEVSYFECRRDTPVFEKRLSEKGYRRPQGLFIQEFPKGTVSINKTWVEAKCAVTVWIHDGKFGGVEKKVVYSSIAEFFKDTRDLSELDEIAEKLKQPKFP